MDDVILVNKRGAPIHLGNKYKLVPGRNRFALAEFEKLKLVKGYDAFIKAGSLVVLDTNRKPQAKPVAVQHEQQSVVPVVVDQVLGQTHQATQVATQVAPVRKVKKFHVVDDKSKGKG